MGDSIRSNLSQFSTCSRRSMMSDVSESDLRRLEELREVGKKAKNEARGIDGESMHSGTSTMSKAERKRQLAIAKTHKLILTKKPRIILKEEDYLNDMDKLITRDFFPHYDNLKDQHDYLNAENDGDSEKMREIAIKYRKRTGERPTTGAWTVGGTPADFGDHSPSRDSEHKDDDGDDIKPDDADEEAEKKKEKPRTGTLSLDRYCVKYTSEDNQSFQKLHRFTEDKKKEEFAYLYAQQEEGDRRCDPSESLKLKSPAEILAIEDARNPGQQKKSGTGNWKYTNKNSMFYGSDLETQKEYEFKKPILPREICHENTRFKKDPFLKPIAPDKLQSVVRSRIRSSIREQGKVGIDGKPVTPARTPYGLLATPSPMPGRDESPFMTWGQLEGTPQRAMTPGSNAAQSPAVNHNLAEAPAFHMGQMNEREDLAHRLAEKVMEKKRDAKNRTVGLAKKSAIGDTPNRIRKAMGKTPEMRSPALNRLLNKHSNKLGIGSNKSLRSSYTPSPQSSRSSSSTPSRNSGRTPGRTPKITGFGSRSIDGIKLKSSLTDGLI